MSAVAAAAAAETTFPFISIFGVAHKTKKYIY